MMIFLSLIETIPYQRMLSGRNQSVFGYLSLLILTALLMIQEGCRKADEQPAYTDFRLISQVEYYKGVSNSNITYQYENNRIVKQEVESKNELLKYEFSYTDTGVISNLFKKYSESWFLKKGTVYAFEDGKVKSVIFREPKGELWKENEKWTFSYDGMNWKEVLIEIQTDDKFDSVSKIEYFYEGDRLLYYNTFKFAEAQWELIREVKFDYVDERLDKTTVFYGGFASEYGPQEQYIFEYESGLNTRIGIAVLISDEWTERSEIVRNYDQNGNMTDETVRLVGDPNYEYRYIYFYEPGKHNREHFPFYDQPLYEYIYPAIDNLQPGQMIQRFQLLNPKI